MKTTLCEKCNKQISNNNYNKHYNSCNGIIEKHKIKINHNWKQENGKYKCPFCNKEYSEKGICSHIWRSHDINGKQHKTYSGEKKTVWNKGLNKETDIRIKKYAKSISKTNSGKTKNKLSNSTKNKISESMKKAHKENRAWNIGKSRWNNKPSKPEEMFMKIIQNEFEDKCYIREYNVGIYSIDFAWIHKKLAIEIDGEQHYRFNEYIKRDKKKDKMLIDNGWKVLRINWSKFCSNTKHYIKICKEFVDNNEINIEHNEEINYKLLERKLKYGDNIPIQCLTKKQKDDLNENRINLIMNSDIDFSKFGWVKKVSELTGMKTQKVNSWMKKYMQDFYIEKCYKKNNKKSN